ncbi:MAG: hypothetical protein E6Q97_00015 [Desulfurellales bacterium]|nr:MAG: hypothetical protein E6Q97_00015 [Desulfurellales bacterium]
MRRKRIPPMMRLSDARRRQLVSDAIHAIDKASETRAPRASVVAAGLHATGWMMVPTATGNHSHVDGDVIYDVANRIGIFVRSDRLWALCVWLREHWRPTAMQMFTKDKKMGEM